MTTPRCDHAAVDFCRTIFGWGTEQISDTDEFRYTTAWFGEEQLLGVWDGDAVLPDGVSSSWTVFLLRCDVGHGAPRRTGGAG